MPEPRTVRRLSDDKVVPYDPRGDAQRRRAAAARAMATPALGKIEVATGYDAYYLGSMTMPLTEYLYRQLDRKPFPYGGSVPLAVAEIDGKRETFSTFQGKPVRVLGVAQNAKLPRLIFPEASQ